MKEISSNSAAGPDGIPASLLLICASELALLIMFKQSLDSGVIDPSFRKSAIGPVFMSGDRTVPIVTIVLSLKQLLLSRYLKECFVSNSYFSYS